MATRSGKTYQEPKRSRRRNIIKETGSTTPPNGKYMDNNLDLSNISNRDLRSRRSSVKNSTFDKSDVSVTKTSLDSATDSNWIVSDLTSKVNGTKSYVNTSSNEMIKPDTPRSTEKKRQHLNNSDISTKKLRKTKSHISDSIHNTSDQVINVTYEKDIDAMEVINNKEVSTNANGKTVEWSGAGLDIDTENDLNCLNVGKTLRHKKKKVKGKKKKQKRKLKEKTEEPSDNVKILNTSIEKDNISEGTSPRNKIDANNSKTNTEKDMDPNDSNKISRIRKSSIKDTTFDKEDKVMDTTYEKDQKINITFDKDSECVNVSGGNFKGNISITASDKNDKSNETFEIDTSRTTDTLQKSQKKRKSSRTNVSLNKSSTSIQNLSKDIFEKDKSVLASPATKRMSLRRQTIDIIISPAKKLDTTFEKESKLETGTKRTSHRLSEVPSLDKLNVTFDKEDMKDNHQNSKSSLISSDNSSISRVSITSDESTEHIVNTTPLLIESSMDETHGNKSPEERPKEVLPPLTPLKREGTFTKEAPEVELPLTPGKRESDIMPAAGCTPYHVSKSSQKKPMLNVTRSIEKRLSVDPGHRMTRVMFCSPIDNPTSVAYEKRKIIKSNLKGSNKSFVFDETSSVTRPARKRSYTQNDADDARTKRSCLAEDLQQSVDRLSRPRTPTTTSKLGETTPKKSNTPYKSKSETKPARTRLPNFAILHQKQFEKMESLGECQERKAKRAKQMLTPSALKITLEKISPKNNADSEKPTTKETTKPKDKTEISSKKPLTFESIKPGFTRFGFRLNLDVNPFSIPPKTDKPKDKLSGTAPKPSLTGATSKLREPSDRREAAKQTVMREKSFVEKRKVNRSENRTFIKGVRTNRRFELQMKLRNID
ncbi:unnamed protein product [Arctia plantaginis]|uniref:Uncharacterized protein n=1 Tax=Arctia plantaginis TaxID=874455 RepID=A0A8S1AWY6_ARCPL|nr:unnamed protein product [Arctia plantaginis]